MTDSAEDVRPELADTSTVIVMPDGPWFCVYGLFEPDNAALASLKEEEEGSDVRFLLLLFFILFFLSVCSTAQ